MPHEKKSPADPLGALATATAGPAAAIAGAAMQTNPRFLNISGRLIRPHRALLHFDFTLARAMSMLLVPLLFTLLTLAAWPLVQQFWDGTIGYLASVLGTPLSVGHHDGVIPMLRGIPYPHVEAGLPGTAQWWIGMVICTVLLLGPSLLPERMMPLAYLARFVGALQFLVQLYFLFWAQNFPHRSGPSAAAMMQSSLILMLLVPWLFGFIYNIFDFGLLRKLALSAMSVLYLVVLAPLQFTLAAVVMAEFSLLWHPLIYLLGTTLLQLILLLSLYAWAMSWERPSQPH